MGSEATWPCRTRSGTRPKRSAHDGCGEKGVECGNRVEAEKIAKWELRHEVGATVDPRAEFAAVLRSLGAVVEGKHPIMDGKPQRIRTENDKRGEQTIIYI